MALIEPVGPTISWPAHLQPTDFAGDSTNEHRCYNPDLGDNVFAARSVLSGYWFSLDVEIGVMSDAKVSGIIHLIEETKTYGKKDFRKRLVVLEQDKGSFTNYVPIEFTRDACDTVDDLNVGDEVEVAYRLSGRRWQRDEASEVKYFLSAEAMSFKLLSGAGGTMTERVTESPNDAFSEASEDDAPF